MQLIWKSARFSSRGASPQTLLEDLRPVVSPPVVSQSPVGNTGWFARDVPCDLLPNPLNVSRRSLSENPNLEELNLCGCSGFSAEVLGDMLRSCSRWASETCWGGFSFLLMWFRFWQFKAGKAGWEREGMTCRVYGTCFTQWATGAAELKWWNSFLSINTCPCNLWHRSFFYGFDD